MSGWRGICGDALPRLARVVALELADVVDDGLGEAVDMGSRAIVTPSSGFEGAS